MDDILIDIDISEDEVEGSEETLNPTRNSDDIDTIYPQANIKVEREQYSIFELNRKFTKKQIILDPEFQRQLVWTKPSLWSALL